MLLYLGMYGVSGDQAFIIIRRKLGVDTDTDGSSGGDNLGRHGGWRRTAGIAAFGGGAFGLERFIGAAGCGRGTVVDRLLHGTTNDGKS